MTAKAAVFAVAALGLTLPAFADEPAPDSQGGRYLFSKQAGGFVRLDTQSGEVALCSEKSVGWACEAAPEDRALLENEIARLRSENAMLKKDILARGLPLPAGVMPESPLAQSDAPQNALPMLRLPNDADIDRMAAFAGRVWHRFVEAVARAQKQVLSKS